MKALANYAPTPQMTAITSGLRSVIACVILAIPLAAVPQAPQADPFDHVVIGAFDPNAWNGLVFDATAYGQHLPFAMRIGSKSGSFLDGETIFDAVSEVGPHAPDGSYALVGWRHYPRTAMVTLEWSRIDRTTVVGRLKSPADIELSSRRIRLSTVTSPAPTTSVETERKYSATIPLTATSLPQFILSSRSTAPSRAVANFLT
jgi:hypothetical protein